MKKFSKSKKIITLIITSILIICLAIIIYRSNIKNVAPDMEEDYIADDGMLKYKSNLNGITIKDRNIEKKDNSFYLKIKMSNESESDKLNIPVEIKFVNIEGQVVYNVGYILEVLLQNMTFETYIQISSEIYDAIEENKIDHIIINEL